MSSTSFAIAKKDLKPISQLYVSVFTNPPWNEDWQYKWAYERLNWIYQFKNFAGFINLDGNKTIVNVRLKAKSYL